MSTRVLLGGLAAVIVILASIYLWQARDRDSSPAAGEVVDGVVQDGSGRRVLYWHDPMVPGKRFERPGKSPFMDMQLVPKYADEASATGVQISSSLAQNLGVRTARVERSEIGEQLTAVGRIEADERRRYAVASRVSGYVERLHVRAVGDPVSKGEKIAEIYSPELLSAQQEYLALLSASSLSNAESLVQAARRRLSLFGMAEREIESITKNRAAQTRFGAYAPVSGFVIDLTAREGAQIEAGATLMSIADLSRVWLIADVPETQSASLRAGATVTAALASAPGKEFSGEVDFIYPSLDADTRTTRVRIVLPNESGELRPGMLANVRLGAAAREALSVPSEAVIYTGERTIVIARENDTFRPVKVRTGVEAGGRTEILEGLEAGQEIVTSGQFLIDSEASLSGVLARLEQAEKQPNSARAADSTAKREDSADSITATGRVVSVDHANGRVTLEHGPIPELGWPAMTMPFRLADREVAHTLSAGDTIQFSLRRKPVDGEYVIESVTRGGGR